MTTGAIVPKRLAEFLRSIPYEVSGQWFYQKSIQLDGYAFNNCRFDHCNIYVSRGIFRLTSCFFGSCILYYSDEARNVIRLFSGQHIPDSVSIIPFLRPVANADGTFTIDGLDT
jgi:hypothetical protein